MTLSHLIVAPADLTAAQREQMFDLFATHYACVSRQSFDADLVAKTWVILLHDEARVIRGFSTQEIYTFVYAGQDQRILFSGDTIIAPAYWGSQELVRGWCAVTARMLAAAGSTPCYWFLISKGYRTYLYLPLFFLTYYPHHQGDDADLKPLLDTVARAKFGNAYNPTSGLIRFDETHGQLTEALTEIPSKRSDDPAVQFFLERNPDFAQGVELACLAPLTLSNTHRLGRSLLTQATLLCHDSA